MKGMVFYATPELCEVAPGVDKKLFIQDCNKCQKSRYIKICYIHCPTEEL